MEIHRHRDESSDGFSFPSTPSETQDPELEFEFGSATPESPSGESSKSSPADHLFFNGKLLPHSFPCKTMTNAVILRTASRASSMSSRDSMSLMSSRSNSTNSSRSSSSCSSARRSSSDNTERARSPFLMYQTGVSYKTQNNNARDRRRRTSEAVAAQVYGTSQRWQFITPVPPLSRDGSCSSSSSSSSRRRTRKLCEGVVREEVKKIKEKERIKTGFGRKLIRSFFLSCMQCHAMEVETSRREDVLTEL